MSCKDTPAACMSCKHTPEARDDRGVRFGRAGVAPLRASSSFFFYLRDVSALPFRYRRLSVSVVCKDRQFLGCNALCFHLADSVCTPRRSSRCGADSGVAPPGSRLISMRQMDIRVGSEDAPRLRIWCMNRGGVGGYKDETNLRMPLLSCPHPNLTSREQHQYSRKPLFRRLL